MSQYRHSHLPKNGFSAAVAYAAVTAVAKELIASVEALFTEMVTHSHSNIHGHIVQPFIHKSTHPFIHTLTHPSKNPSIQNRKSCFWQC